MKWNHARKLINKNSTPKKKKKKENNNREQGPNLKQPINIGLQSIIFAIILREMACSQNFHNKSYVASYYLLLLVGKKVI